MSGQDIVEALNATEGDIEKAADLVSDRVQRNSPSK